jgi:hypothetical protein
MTDKDSAIIRLSTLIQRTAAQRTLVAGPLTLVASLAVLAATPHWMPEGPGRVDNLVFPVVGFPLIWAVAFFYACLADEPRRAARVLGIVTALQFGIIGFSLFLAG